MVDKTYTEPVDISALLTYLSNRWWKICLGMIIGGLIGFMTTYLIKPLYESFATFSVTIDYTQTGALSDIQEDQAMRGVGSVIFSDEVVNRTLNEIIEKQLIENQDVFFEHAFLDRNEFRWTIRYRDGNPQIAQQIASTWAGNADLALAAGLEHALIADSYYHILESLTNCFQRFPPTQNNTRVCGFSDFSELLDAIQTISQQIQQEKNQSMGLFSALNIKLVEVGGIPAQPVRYNRNVLVLSGAIIGWMILVVFLSMRFFLKERNFVE